MDKSDAWGALEMGGLRVLVAVGISAVAYKLISPKGKSTKPLDSARRGAAWGTFSALSTTLPDVLHTFSPQAWLKLAICLIATLIFGFLMGFAIGSIRFWKRKPKIDTASVGTGESKKVDSASYSEIPAKDRQDIYTVVADEIESKNVDRGVWARAFAEADGDAEKTKASYIRLRVNQGDEDNKPANFHWGTPRILSLALAAIAVALAVLIGLGGVYLMNRPSPESLFSEGMKQLELKDEKTAADLFLEAANRGNTQAQWQLGSMYKKGGGQLSKNDQEATKWITKAAEGGQPEAQFLLGLPHGTETAETYREHIRWCRMAADQGNAEAQAQMSYYYSQDFGIEKNVFEAARWLRMAAKQGNARAQEDLAKHYDSGLGVPEDKVLAAIWYRKAAEQGQTCAQEALGRRYEDGNGVTEDKEKSIFWYRKAAAQESITAGSITAARRLSQMYFNGSGVPIDYKESMKWAFIAAKNGNVECQKLCMAEAESGNPQAQCIMATIFWWKGNYQESLKWNQRAAEQGCAEGKKGLASLYFNGDGVEKNYKTAFNLFHQVADKGDASAQYSVGTFYEEGYGVEKNENEALSWYKRAAAQGYENAINRLID